MREEGPCGSGCKPPPEDWAKCSVFMTLPCWAGEIMTGNEHSHRCQAKAPGLKNRTKKSGVSWSLDKTGDRKWKKKKIREKCSVMQFHPQGKVGKYHTILPQKMLVKIVTGSNIMTMKKARKCHINDFRWVFLFYSFLSNEDCAPKSTQKPLLPCKTDILKMLEGEMFGEPRQQHGFPIENNGYTVSFLRKRNLGSETISA